MNSFYPSHCLPKLAVLVLLFIILTGCKDSRPTSQTISLTYAGFSTIDTKNVTNIREELEKSEVNFISEKIKIDEINKYYWRKKGDDFKVNVRSQDSITYFVLAQGFYSQVLVIEADAPYNSENSKKVKNDIKVLYESYKQMDALECYNECISNDEYRWAFDTFFSGSIFSLTIVGIILALFSIVGIFLNKYISSSVSSYINGVSSIYNLDNRVRLSIQYLTDQHNAVQTYYNAFKFLNSIKSSENYIALDLIAQLDLCRNSFVDTENKIKKTGVLIDKMQRKTNLLNYKTDINIVAIEKNFTEVSAHIFTSMAFFEAYLLYFIETNEIVKGSLSGYGELKKTSIEKSLHYLDEYNNIRSKLKHQRYSLLNSIEESRLRVEFILTSYTDYKSDINWPKEFSKLFSYKKSNISWEEEITKQWVGMFHKDKIESFWPRKELISKVDNN